MHEASQHERNAFLTWTYADEHLPSDLSVSVRAVQLLFKRLRHEVGAVRHATCGEYGDQGGRPHYHSILFGEDFAADRFPWQRSPTGGLLYRSPTLERVWPFGHVLVGDVTRSSAGYVAGYVRKKLDGEDAEAALRRRSVDPETGEVREWRVAPPFFVTSRRPGIGAAWFDRFSGDAFPSDFLIVEGDRVPVPRYYLDKLTEAERLPIVARRRERARAHAAENLPARLMVRHESARLRARRFLRDLDAST